MFIVKRFAKEPTLQEKISIHQNPSNQPTTEILVLPISPAAQIQVHSGGGVGSCACACCERLPALPCYALPLSCPPLPSSFLPPSSFALLLPGPSTFVAIFCFVCAAPRHGACARRGGGGRRRRRACMHAHPPPHAPPRPARRAAAPVTRHVRFDFLPKICLFTLLVPPA